MTVTLCVTRAGPGLSFPSAGKANNRPDDSERAGLGYQAQLGVGLRVLRRFCLRWMSAATRVTGGHIPLEEKGPLFRPSTRIPHPHPSSFELSAEGV
jgi:hypothetical protein